MEELLACILLWQEGLLPWEAYEEKLDALFLEDPENELLQELEWEGKNPKDTTARVRTYFGSHSREVRTDVLGRFFMARLKEVYWREDLDIRWFADRMYLLWEDLPPWLQDVQPFWTLCYADDPLSWGDEKQTREIYREMLDYYDREEGQPQP